MKTVYKFLGLGVMMTALAAASITPSFAQEETEKTALYTKFTACYKETDAMKRDACYAVGKEYLDKYEKDKDEYGTFVRKKYDQYTTAKNADALYTRFNTSFKDTKNVNSDEAFASGKDIVNKYPDLIDVPIVLASVGFDNAALKTPNDKYNADTINYAKMVIQKIEAGKPSDKYGAFGIYEYKNDKFPDGKSNTLGWMNYTIGYIMFNRMGQKKEALPYLYKATQFNSGTKTNPEIYRTIGSYYVSEFLRMDTDRIAQIKAAGDQDTEETKAIFALQKGYADRAVEAYARAYKVASTDPKDKAFRDNILSRVKELYSIRFNKNMSGFDAYMASVMNKPLTDPSLAVTPVVETAPATTVAPAAAASMTTTTETAKPVASVGNGGTAAATSSTTTVKSTTTTTNGTSVTTTTQIKTKTPVKKAAVKKKRTR